MTSHSRRLSEEEIMDDDLELTIANCRISLKNDMRLAVLENPIKRDSSTTVSTGEGPVAKIVIKKMEVAHVFYTGDHGQIVKSRPELTQLPTIRYFHQDSWAECMTGFTVSDKLAGRLPPYGLRLCLRSKVLFMYQTKFFWMYMVDEEEGHHTERSPRPRKLLKVPYLIALAEELEIVGNNALAEEFRLVDARQRKLNSIDEKTKLVRKFQVSHPGVFKYLRLIDLIGLTQRIAPETAFFTAPVLEELLSTASTNRIYNKLQVEWRARPRVTGGTRETATRRAKETFFQLYPGGNWYIFKTTGKIE